MSREIPTNRLGTRKSGSRNRAILARRLPFLHPKPLHWALPRAGCLVGERSDCRVDVEEPMKSLIEAIVQALVDKPEEVQIKEVEVEVEVKEV